MDRFSNRNLTFMSIKFSSSSSNFEDFSCIDTDHLNDPPDADFLYSARPPRNKSLATVYRNDGNTGLI